ncbi:MAG TPA: PxKF domain-containing protein, partial [Pyrinomonadaceae bacterium]
GVTVANLDTTLGLPTINDNCAGVTFARSGVPAGNVFPLGNTTVTYTATDKSGNTASANQVVTVVDNTPPALTCPADVVVYLPLNSTATSMTVNYPNATATDNCAGTVGVTYSIASGSTFSVGTTPITVNATDAHGNSSSCSFNVTVLYNFTGFFAPVDNLPILNVVNAGRAIPVKFSLSGNKGLNIFAAGSPSTVSINCDGSAPQSDIEETVNAGSSSLSYTSGSDQYVYVWKTDSSWAGTCRQLVVKLNDGTEHKANFKFR